MKRILSLLLVALMALGCMSAMAETTPEPIEFSIFIDMPWYWVDVWGGDPVSQEITKRSGVSFDITRATDGQQLGLLIAADDLPEIVYTDSTAAGALLSDSEVCYSYNELAEKYGVDLHADATSMAINTSPDGNVYALKNTFAPQSVYDSGKQTSGPGTASLAYRVDIWEAIGSPEFNTLEDVEAALIKCKEMFPDVIPLLPDPGYLPYFSYHLGLNGTPDIGYNAEGKPVFGLQVEGMKDYYALLNRFAREGLITEESMTYNYDRFKEVRNAGHSFMQLRSSQEQSEANTDAITAGTDYRWKLIDHALTEEYMMPNTGIGWAGWYITKKCEDPQRAIEFISWARSEEGRQLASWGIKGEHWDYDEQGRTVYPQAYKDGLAAGKAKQTDYGVGMWIFGDQGEENALVDWSATDENQLDTFEWVLDSGSKVKVMSELYFCTPKDGDMKYVWDALADLKTSEMLKVIFAPTEADFDAAWDSWVAQSEALGMNELADWMAEQLVAYNATMAG